jgi:hypothetical protein
MSTFWGVELHILTVFIFLAYFFVMIQIVIDLFRDTELGGFAKLLWFVGLIFLPFLTALVYIIARGGGMAERRRAEADRIRNATEGYIREIAGTSSPADQIGHAKALLDAGTINKEEFDRLKAKALA